MLRTCTDNHRARIQPALPIWKVLASLASDARKHTFLLQNIIWSRRIASHMLYYVPRVALRSLRRVWKELGKIWQLHTLKLSSRCVVECSLPCKTDTGLLCTSQYVLRSLSSSCFCVIFVCINLRELHLSHCHSLELVCESRLSRVV